MRYRITALLLFSLVPGWAQRGFAPRVALPSESKRWAVLIGIDRYEDSNISPLIGAANDARSIKETLVQHAGFPEQQVLVLATGTGGQQPTRAVILHRMANVLKQVPRDGLLLVAFSGHGLERKKQAFLLPADAQVSDDPSILEDTAVNVRRLRDMIQQAGVQQVIIALDACRNDPGGRADAPNPMSQAFASQFQFDVQNSGIEAFATLYSTAVGYRAWEDPNRRRGYFSYALEQALRGAAANGRGEITLGSAVSYVQTWVAKQVSIDLGPDKRQQPYAEVAGYRADELVVSAAKTRTGYRPPEPPVRPPVIPVQEDNPRQELERTLGQIQAASIAQDWEQLNEFQLNRNSASYVEQTRKQLEQLRRQGSYMEMRWENFQIEEMGPRTAKVRVTVWVTLQIQGQYMRAYQPAMMNFERVNGKWLMGTGKETGELKVVEQRGVR